MPTLDELFAQNKQRRGTVTCKECKKKFVWRVKRSQEGYSKKQVEYMKNKFVCKECQPK